MNLMIFWPNLSRRYLRTPHQLPITTAMNLCLEKSGPKLTAGQQALQRKGNHSANGMINILSLSYPKGGIHIKRMLGQTQETELGGRSRQNQNRV